MDSSQDGIDGFSEASGDLGRILHHALKGEVKRVAHMMSSAAHRAPVKRGEDSWDDAVDGSDFTAKGKLRALRYSAQRRNVSELKPGVGTI